jgi:hypothetical protein
MLEPRPAHRLAEQEAEYRRVQGAQDRRRKSDAESRDVERAALHRMKIVIEAADFMTQLPLLKRDAAAIEPGYGVLDVDRHVRIGAECLHDPEHRAGPRPSVGSGTYQFPMNMIERMPDQILIEGFAVDLHVADDVGEPPGQHLRRDAPDEVVADMHDHASERVVLQGSFGRGQRLEGPGQPARCRQGKPTAKHLKLQ